MLREISVRGENCNDTKILITQVLYFHIYFGGAAEVNILQLLNIFLQFNFYPVQIPDKRFI